MPGRLGGQHRDRHRDDLAHLLLVPAERAADRDPVDAGGGDRRGRRAAQVLVGAALDDPEDRLVGGPVLAVPVEAALEPAVGPLGRAGRVVVVGAERRALVEDEGDVGAELRLHLHRALRREEVLGAVDVGAEADAVLADVEHAALERRPPAPALDLVGDAPEGKRKHLETTGIGDDRPVPAHELVKPAELGDPLAARRQHQVVGVAEDHLVAEPARPRPEAAP